MYWSVQVLPSGSANGATVPQVAIAWSNGTLAELKHLLPPAKVEYVEKQPTLEDVFLAVVGTTDQDAAGTVVPCPASSLTLFHTSMRA
jgi:hypothetical protein